MIARRKADHAGTDFLHDACPLMAEDDRERRRMDALGDVEVGVADPARGHADEHLARLGRIELELLDDERLPEFVQDGCPDHLRAPARTRTGSDLNPLTKFELRRTGGPASSKRTSERGSPRAGS